MILVILERDVYIYTSLFLKTNNIQKKTNNHLPMKKAGLFLVIISFFFNGFSQSDIYSTDFYKSLENTHDVITLHNWGPYSKKYAGISHIPDIQKGMRFDITAMPGYYRNRVLVPNVLFESSYYPWDINADLTKITYRYELEWKDKVYVNVTYFILDSTTVLVDMHSVNNTTLNQELQLNLAAFINYPDAYPRVKAQYPDNVTYIDGIEYKDLQFATPRPSDNLVYNGWYRGEKHNSAYLNGKAIAKGFGKEKGDAVTYQFNLSENTKEGILTLRYRLKKNTNNTLEFKGLINQTIALKSSGQFELIQIPYKSENQTAQLKIQCLGNGAVEIDGFFIGSEKDSKNIKILPQKKNFIPEFEKDLEHNTVIMHYPDVDNYYGIAWDFDDCMVREVLDEELDVIFKKYVHEHNYLVFTGDSNGHYLNVFMRPVQLKPQSDTHTYGLICTGNQQNVKKTIATFKQNETQYVSNSIASDDVFENDLPQGHPYIFSQNMMRTALQSNIVYPIYTQGEYIRHFTPGKWWNSLYTWDAGFIALGLSEINTQKAIEFINTYTTPEGSQSAFIHHGSPVPTQFYTFYDLWNKTQSKELLNYFYPRLKQYYEFMAGNASGSTINSLHSNLLKTWDYFYNSGGWDDYPPQKAVRDNHLEKTVTPVITTAHIIRTAKILRKIAEETNNKTDIKHYDADIKKFTTALQKTAWDENAGYFSYMVHDTLGNAKEIYRHPESGTNYNMGLDGAYPIFSGICTKAQEDSLSYKILSNKHMWSKAGICVVDKQAPYYRIDGYWNGAVWMPHQWFMWKTMLDLGKTDAAWQIADKALNIWKKETDETYFTYEHWFAATGRGAGWHQFGALSAPVLSWYSAYYKPGTVSTGYEIWIEKQSFADDFSTYSATLSFDEATKAHPRSMIICLNPAYDYNISLNNKPIEVNKRYNGLLEIQLPSTNKTSTLKISKL